LWEILRGRTRNAQVASSSLAAGSRIHASDAGFLTARWWGDPFVTTACVPIVRRGRGPPFDVIITREALNYQRMINSIVAIWERGLYLPIEMSHATSHLRSG